MRDAGLDDRPEDMTAVSTQQTSPPPQLSNRPAAASSRVSLHHQYLHSTSNSNTNTNANANANANGGSRPPALDRRASPAMAPRLEVNGSSRPADGPHSDAEPAHPVPNGRNGPEITLNGNTDTEQRPSTAPGRRNGSVSLESKDDIESHRATRPVKPLLLRSKSEFTSRLMDDSDSVDDDIPEWGARHGFEDHYQSEDIISQLANVGSIALAAVTPEACSMANIHDLVTLD